MTEDQLLAADVAAIVDRLRDGVSIRFTRYEKLPEPTMQWYGYGGEGLWKCEGCGGLQAGQSRWPGGVKRCVACGPGEGWVPCPAGAGHEKCVLCKGLRYVEELR